jgi:hypothetical protein
MKKNKYEKSPEQIAYEYGISTSIKYLNSLFVQYRHNPDIHTGLGDIRLTFGNQEEILNELEKYKRFEYPYSCGTCKAPLD